jgi:hypothetical protein
MSDEKNEVPRIQQTGEKLPINKDTLDIIVANIIPSSKYFEARFDHLEHRVIRIETELKDFRSDVDKRFISIESDMKNFRSDMDSRFTQSRQYMDGRFDEAKRDNNDRFKEVIASINRLTDNLQDRDKEQRGFTLRMFSISIFVSFVGVLGVALKLFGV